MTGAPLTIVAESLRKAFPAPGGGTVPAMDNVSLSVRTGALTALVGPDGAGKTTLIRMVAGLMAPDAGRLRVLDIDVVKRPQAVQDRISYMPQRFGLYEDLSVQENLDLYADLHGVPQTVRTERFGRLLEMTDLAAFTARPAGKLSGGMKQKLGLACTLVRSPGLAAARRAERRRRSAVATRTVGHRAAVGGRRAAERAHQHGLHGRSRTVRAGLRDAPGSDTQRRRTGDATHARARPDVRRRSTARRAGTAAPVALVRCRRRRAGRGPEGRRRSLHPPTDSPSERLQELLGAARPEPRPEELEDAFMMMLRQRDEQAPTGPPFDLCFITAYEVYFKTLKNEFPELYGECFIRKPIKIEDLVSKIDEELNLKSNKH